MRRTIFTVTPEALRDIALLWAWVVLADAAAYKTAASDDDAAGIRLANACADFTDAVLFGADVDPNEFAREEVASRLYGALRSEEEVGESTMAAIKWVLDAYFFKTTDGRRKCGALKPDEFGIAAEG